MYFVSLCVLCIRAVFCFCFRLVFLLLWFLVVASLLLLLFLLLLVGVVGVGLRIFLETR